jgi:alkylation response protein AidB-like acyl-CoA dehydrogenase
VASARYGGIWELEIGRAHTPWFYYSDVRIDDKYRVGEVNGGWAVLREALNAEHGTVERDAHGLQKLAVMTEHLMLLAEAVDNIAGITPLGDDSVKYRLGRSIARMEAAMSTRRCSVAWRLRRPCATSRRI